MRIIITCALALLMSCSLFATQTGTATKVLTQAQTSLGNMNQTTTCTIANKIFSYEAPSESVCTFIVALNK